MSYDTLNYSKEFDLLDFWYFHWSWLHLDNQTTLSFEVYLFEITEGL